MCGTLPLFLSPPIFAVILTDALACSYQFIALSTRTLVRTNRVVTLMLAYTEPAFIDVYTRKKHILNMHSMAERL